MQTAAAGLCHSDLHFMEGKYPHPVPAVLGHESAGVVEAVGSQVTYVQPGRPRDLVHQRLLRRVPLLPLRPPEPLRQGRDSPRTRPARRGCGAATRPSIQFVDLSSFAEQLLVHENMLVKIRPDMPLDKAALIGCGVTTGVGAVMNTAKVRPGEIVAVIGCGGIGLNAIQAAAIVGAGRIIAVDRVASKLATGARRSARPTSSTRRPATRSVAVLELTGGGVDHAFEAIGLEGDRASRRSTCCARAAPPR